MEQNLNHKPKLSSDVWSTSELHSASHSDSVHVSHFSTEPVRRFAPKAIIITGAAVIGLVATGIFGTQIYKFYAKNTAAVTPIEQIPTDSNKQISSAQELNAGTDSPAPEPPPTSQPSSKTPPPSPPPAPPAAPAANTTNCLPPNPSQYATYFITKTNSQYLQTNSYVSTTKLYAALQFAGLLDTVNAKQYVVLAMSDYQWDNLSQAQLDFMNASPENMRSVLGWQIITSCITWDGVNPVKDLTVGATKSVNTVNGLVTYTHNYSGLGTFGSGNVGIWDWFTSNGSVTIAGFVKPPQI